MFNVKIIRIKDIIKYVLVLIIMYVVFKFLIQDMNFKEILDQKIDINLSKIDNVIIGNGNNFIENILNNSEENTSESLNTNVMNEILKEEIAFLSNDFEEQEESKQIADDGLVNSTENVEVIDDNQLQKETEVVTTNPIVDNYNKEYNGVTIKNETSYELTDDILNTSSLNINTDNIIIFHTHTCESYTQTDTSQYTLTGNYRTTDLEYTVAKVGDELTNNLQNCGFNVNHDKTYHDYPSYTGSYNRSLETVQNLLQNFNSDIIIDLHRDAIGSNSNYAPLVKIGNDYCAQLMFVIGTNGGGLYHPNWENNLKFAVRIQEKANEIYPGLFKTIVLRNSRYNQHLANAACIIEVGATGNTLEQAKNSMKYLSNVFYETLKK